VEGRMIADVLLAGIAGAMIYIANHLPEDKLLSGLIAYSMAFALITLIYSSKH